MKRKRIKGQGIVFVDIKHRNHIFLRNLVECIEDSSRQAQRINVGTCRKRVGEIMQYIVLRQVRNSLTEIDGIGRIGFQGIGQLNENGFSTQSYIGMRQ